MDRDKAGEGNDFYPSVICSNIKRPSIGIDIAYTFCEFCAWVAYNGQFTNSDAL